MTGLSPETKHDQTVAVVVFILVPFLVSAAFWVSPFLGWPALFIGACFCLGSALVIASPTKDEGSES